MMYVSNLVDLQQVVHQGPSSMHCYYQSLLDHHSDHITHIGKQACRIHTTRGQQCSRLAQTWITALQVCYLSRDLIVHEH
jgi:hypothetical protein